MVLWVSQHYNSYQRQSNPYPRLQTKPEVPKSLVICSYYDKMTLAFPVFQTLMAKAIKNPLSLSLHFHLLCFFWCQYLPLNKCSLLSLKSFSCDSFLCREKTVKGGQPLLLMFFLGFFGCFFCLQIIVVAPSSLWSHTQFSPIVSYLMRSLQKLCTYSLFYLLLCLLQIFTNRGSK